MFAIALSQMILAIFGFVLKGGREKLMKKRCKKCLTIFEENLEKCPVCGSIEYWEIEFPDPVWE